MPRHNLRLIESLPSLEAEICREVVPRLASRVNLEFDPAELASAQSVDIVAGEAFEAQERAALTQIRAACGGVPLTIWGEASDQALIGTAISRLCSSDQPRGAFVVILGTRRSLAPWVASLRARGALVLATREAPCAIIDRIDELATAGLDRPGLLCATPELAERLRLPRTASLPQPEATPVES
jgi:hypothetical protein